MDEVDLDVAALFEGVLDQAGDVAFVLDNENTCAHPFTIAGGDFAGVTRLLNVRYQDRPRTRQLGAICTGRVAVGDPGDKPRARSGRACFGRQADREQRAAAVTVRRRHLAAVQLDEMLDDRQPKAGAAGPRSGLVHSVEALEDPRQIFIRDSRA